jgi:ribonucleoside-diphosphate reductase alpha chain
LGPEHNHLHDEDLGGLIERSVETVDLSEIAASVEASVAAVARDIANPVGMQVAALETRLNSGPRDLHVKRAEAKMKGYEGDACGTCGNFTLVRNGTCMKCNTCGSTSGCS